MNYNPEYTTLKKVGNIFISDEEKEILNNYGIKIESCKNLSDLIFKIEALNIHDDILENVLDNLDERNYYENFNK